jgi:flagellar biosynthesis protein FlhA
MGFLIPPISIQDNIELANDEYRILVRGLERARGTVQPSSHLAINPGDVHGNIEGIRTVDPAFGFDAIWITPNKVETAESMGYTVVDAASVVATHVTKIVKEYAADLLSRQDVSNMLELVKETNKAVVEELIPGKLVIGVVHRVLQHLLDERVPIHDLPVILEVLSDYAEHTKDPVLLCEFARQALKGHIISQYIGEDRTLYAITLAPALEEEIQNAITQSPRGGGVLSMPPERAVELTDSLKNMRDSLSIRTNSDIVLLVSPLIRLHLFRIVERKIESLPVISYSEVSDDVPLQILGALSLDGEVENAA